MEKLGAVPVSAKRCRFVAWAPAASQLSVVLCRDGQQIVPMRPHCGFHVAEVLAPVGTRYFFRMPDGRGLPDPASRFQPDGVRGPSEIVDTSEFRWTDAGFAGHAMREFVIYELHVGTFTEEGTFRAATARLDEFADLGITAVELMPIAQFPGSRNWGYDAVFPFAVQNSYGGPSGLQGFVNEAHTRGVSVVLDVVYNHLGPEGNYAGAFGPYFTDRYRTPWGSAINFDGPDSDPVRAFFIQNALYWLEEFHVDALRLDAVHGIFDFNARHFLAELKEQVQALGERTGRQLHVIAESDRNDARLLRPPPAGGYGLDAQWSDDFHHALHTLLTRETRGYYVDFGSLEDLCAVMREGWRFSGQYSRFRRRRHGDSPEGTEPWQFVVFSQNHDQVGNRAQGERLVQLTDLDSARLAAGVTLLSPFVPLLFMGEEYGETRPFLYFTSHGDAALAEAVRKGRREEFAAFGWSGEIPDPQDEATFKRSVLNYAARNTEPHRSLWKLYQQLIALRKRFALGEAKPKVRCDKATRTLMLEYFDGPGSLAIVFYFGDQAARIPLHLEFEPYSVRLNSSEPSSRHAASEKACKGSFPFGRRSFVVFKSIEAG
jgi:maltooligosyltrehalose trehalohydrolase